MKLRPLVLPSQSGSPRRFVALGAMAAVLTACGGGDDRSTDPLKAIVACSELAGQTIGNVQVVAAVPVPATADIPSFCKVNGTETGTQHDIEVRLPETWTQRFVQQGGGGFDGFAGGSGKRSTTLTIDGSPVGVRSIRDARSSVDARCSVRTCSSMSQPSSVNARRRSMDARSPMSVSDSGGSATKLPVNVSGSASGRLCAMGAMVTQNGARGCVTGDARSCARG